MSDAGLGVAKLGEGGDGESLFNMKKTVIYGVDGANFLWLAWVTFRNLCSNEELGWV